MNYLTFFTVAQDDDQSICPRKLLQTTCCDHMWSWSYFIHIQSTHLQYFMEVNMLLLHTKYILNNNFLFQWPKGTRPCTSMNICMKLNLWMPLTEPHRSRMDPRALARYEKDLSQSYLVYCFGFFGFVLSFKNTYLHSQVEIEVPQTCSFIIRTTGCSLSEVVDMDTDGNTVFGPSPSSDAFAAEMERYFT